jgi:thiol-disulfide isomerase/thioredoxin
MTASSRHSSWIAVMLVGLVVIALTIGIVNYWPKSKSGEKAKDDPNVPEDTPSPLVSQPRPDFSMSDTAGTHRAIKEWDGKVLAVNFWATWCGPCKEEIPEFNALQKLYGPKGMQFIGVALDDKKSVRTYLKSNPINYPVLVDGEDAAAQLATRYGDDQGVVPYTAFIDRKGRIAFIQYGSISGDLAKKIIESLL